MPPLYFLVPDFASSILYPVLEMFPSRFDWVTYNAVLMRSVGVTATTDSTAPAIMPARIPRDGASLPFSSMSTFLMASKQTNLTLALNAVPYVVSVTDMRGSKAPRVVKTHDDEC
ncbi:hypothetical protein IMZ48_14725 [Candidatus Bathyarchaeota archaeon]|nr:hypothetical protein [Candidatus Bathyarchaeota archaeon]